MTTILHPLFILGIFTVLRDIVQGLFDSKPLDDQLIEGAVSFTLDNTNVNIRHFCITDVILTIILPNGLRLFCSFRLEPVF